MNNFKTLSGAALALILLSLTSVSIANTIWVDPAHTVTAQTQQTSATPPVDPGTAAVGLPVNVNDITSDQDPTKLVLTSEQTHQALVWGLTPEQEKRYVFLLQNKASVQYSGRNLSPVWILGLNAQTESERQFYATLAAQQERQFIAQTLAWHSAFSTAYSQLVQGIPILKPFDVQKFSPYNTQAMVYQTGDILDLFLQPSDPVRAVLSNLLTALTKNPSVTLNIYFVGSGLDANQIQAWAHAQALPVSLVAAKRITLNEGNSRYEALTMDKKTLPLLLLIRQGQAFPIDKGQL